jgi:uncharacterized protein (DUF2342 family)
MSRRRQNRSAPEGILQRLRGLDMKMRQDELGKQFSDAVAERHGIGTLSRGWGRPQAIPSAAGLADPGASCAGEAAAGPRRPGRRSGSDARPLPSTRQPA